MSQRLLSKKIWIGVLTLTCVFLLLTYFWMDYTNRLILQTEKERQEEQLAEIASQTEKEPLIYAEPVEEVVQQAEEPLQEQRMEIQFPCMVQLVDGKIGIYSEEGKEIRQLYQVGELLGEKDAALLRKGIWIDGQEELISLCESYHLQ